MFYLFLCIIEGQDMSLLSAFMGLIAHWYHVDSSNDFSYNGCFAYDGLPNVILPNLT